jgi:hypothetical protein
MEQHALSPTLYEVLGVSETVSVDEVRRLRRELARRYHPDVAPVPDPQRLMRVLEACDVLGDQQRRGEYDARLAAYRPQAPETVSVAPRPWTGVKRFPWSTMWLQAVAYGLGAATLPGYVTAYWIGSDLSPASAQSSPHMLLLNSPVLVTLGVQALLAVSAVVGVHAFRYARETRRSPAVGGSVVWRS